MVRALGVAVVLASCVALAGPADDACKALAQRAVADAFPEAQALLCRGTAPDCASRGEAACTASAACVAKRGSGSGPGCSPCTPDFVFWGCEAAPVDVVVAQVLAFDACTKKQGTWSRRDGPFGSCTMPTGMVTGRVINASADTVMRVNGEEQPKVLQGVAYRLSLEANVPTKLEVLDRKTGKVVSQTVTLKPKEQRSLHFTFPK